MNRWMLLTHELLGLSSALNDGFDMIQESIEVGRLCPVSKDAALLKNLRQTANHLRDFLEPLDPAALSDKNPCDLNDVIACSCRINQFSLQKRAITVESTIGGELKIAVPYHVITLVASSLIGNAVHMLKTGDTIFISAIEEVDRVILRIRDDGPGIDPAIVSNLFKPRVTTREGGGGWGLYLTELLLIENRATIELTDNGPGGAEFTLYFPKPEQEDR